MTLSLDATEALVSPGSVAPQPSGVFANAGRVEVNNVTTASDAVVLNGSTSVDGYSLAPSFTGGNFTIEEAVAILSAENSASVTAGEGFVLNIVADAGAIKTAISGNGAALAALQSADNVKAVDATVDDAVAVNASSPIADSFGDLVDMVSPEGQPGDAVYTIDQYLAATDYGC